MKQRKTPYYVLCAVLLAGLAVLFLFPLYWIVTGSVKDKSEILVRAGQAVHWFPAAPTAENYRKLLKTAVSWALPGGAVKLPAAVKWLFNSVFISLMAMLLSCVTASLAGYVLAKKHFSGKKLVFTLFVCAMALPKQVILIPLVTLAKSLGLSESLWSVIFPIVGWPFGVFLMKQFSETIPSSLLEAARIDGASELGTFWNVALPIIKPGVGALAIFTFISAWNEYPLQLVMLHKNEVKTIALGIAGLQAEMSTDYGLIMAGAALGAVPIIAVFVIFQKYFTQGITMGSVKG